MTGDKLMLLEDHCRPAAVGNQDVPLGQVAEAFNRYLL
jgi:hypothetical protein